MKVTVAKTAGFCFGVDRAVRMVEEELSRGTGPIFTFGPIIHNETVVEDLRARGASPVGREELEAMARDPARRVPGSAIVIRSHGISAEEEELVRRAGLRVADATCPFVKKIHRIVEEAAQNGRRPVICGDPEHPEVKAILSRAGKNACVVTDPDEIAGIPHDMPLTAVAQTTFYAKKYKEIVEKISALSYDAVVVDTICNATQMRQSEAAALAARTGTMIVIGGRHSSNTAKLYRICAELCPRTYYIQTLEDLIAQKFEPAGSVGITAGASTPKEIIEEVQNFVTGNF